MIDKEYIKLLHDILKDSINDKKTTKRSIILLYEILLSQYIPNVDLKKAFGLKIEAYKQLLESIELHYKLFPFLFEKKIIDKITSYDSSGNFIAYTDWDVCKNNCTIFFNKRQIGSYCLSEKRKVIDKDYKSNNKRYFTFAKNFKDDINHEIGHVFHFYLINHLKKYLEHDKIIAPLWTKTRFDIDETDVKKMSDYSMTNFFEFIAECWSGGLRKNKNKNTIIDGVYERMKFLINENIN